MLCFFVPETKNEVKKEDKFDLHTLTSVLKNYKIWLVTFLIMGVYMFQSGLSVFVTFIQEALTVTAMVVVALGILRTYLFRAIFSAPSGKLADKSGKYILFITIGLFISSILCLIAIIIQV
ncbi:hypothetical protein [Spiroplasma taiwanense]|uniref:hypothetical protein n=1 Tax=Spiroplasma taiwanense TaxID=2145 RepID=UPI00041BAB55|nr:hypothetical protein [Spiroplasma taiwanense]